MYPISTKFILLKKHLPQLLSIMALVSLTVLPFILTAYGLSLLTQILIFGIFALSLDILIGYTGLVSFNHATFLGVGAYSVGILVTHGWSNFWLTSLAGITTALLLALFLGLLVLRSSGPYFLMITLAWGQMVFAIAWKWRSLTGGDDGLPGISRPEIGIPINMWNEHNFYFLVLFFFLSTIFLLHKFIHSPLGQSIIGVRESESRMDALGYNTWFLKYLAYIISGGFAGLAGVLYVYYNGFISPQELNWSMSGFVLLMVIIGGSRIIWGPVLGAAVILVLQNLISAYTEHWPLFLGIIFVVCVMYAKEGIAGYLIKLWNKGGENYASLRNKKSQ